MYRRLMISLLLLCFFLCSGCAVTLYTWKDLPPEPLPAHKSKSHAERQAIYDHYAIADIRGSGFLNFETQPRFTTADAQGRYYDLYTYAPVILQTAPQTARLFDEARVWSRWQLGVDSSLLLAVFAPLTVRTFADEAISPETGKWIFVGMVAALLALGTAEYCLELQEYERYEQIRQILNQALSKTWLESEPQKP